ncbi:MAG TPA: class I SAM-dependent methyltransferase, partial [Anaerolineaceae bacterium]|nr:class I SAM-dependent methyltransferase [Anaerolineaceae bacterium]
MNEITLKTGKDKAVHRKHPWIFSGAIGTVKGNPVNGEPVRVFNSNKDFIGIGSYSPQSQIRVRMWTFQNEEINEEFFLKKIKSSIESRKQALYGFNDTAWRLVFAESDQIPWFIVDQYNDVLIIQVLFSGVEYFRDQILSALKDATKIENVYERSDLDVRKLEGLPEQTGLVGGVVPDLVEIVENGYKFLVDIKNGHKTGFYIDQRINRKIVGNYCKGKSVLNVFSYTGG